MAFAPTEELAGGAVEDEASKPNGFTAAFAMAPSSPGGRRLLGRSAVPSDRAGSVAAFTVTVTEAGGGVDVGTLCRAPKLN